MAHRVGSKAWIAARNAKISKAMRKKWAKKGKKKPVVKPKKSVGRPRWSAARTVAPKGFMNFTGKVAGRKATISIPVTISFE